MRDWLSMTIELAAKLLWKATTDGASGAMLGRAPPLRVTGARRSSSL
jgi:hypothetical protein